MEFDDLSRRVIGACVEVHRELGPGLLESVYASCLCIELAARGMRVDRELEVPVLYKGEPLGVTLRADLCVEGALLIALKSVEEISAVHVAQLATYLRLTGLTVGLVVNFNVPVLRQGIRRVVNGWRGPRSRIDAPSPAGTRARG